MLVLPSAGTLTRHAITRDLFDGVLVVALVAHCTAAAVGCLSRSDLSCLLQNDADVTWCPALPGSDFKLTVIANTQYPT